MDKNIPMEKWENLYNLAEKLKKMKPWENMDESDIFGVQNPLNNEIGYFTIIGGGGDVFGIIIYTGAEGLDSYMKIISGEYSAEKPDTLMNQKCIAVTFAPKDYLEKEDIDLMKKLGIKVKSNSLYPVFRNFTPGYFPWFLTHEEVDYAKLALEQAIETINRFEQNPDIFKKAPKKGHYLTRVPQKNENIFIWKDEWLKPEPFKQEYTPAVVIDDIRLQKLKKAITKSDNTWEIDSFHAIEAVQHKKGERPYFPKTTIIADYKTERILNVILVTISEKYETKFIDEFISLIERLKITPKEIHVEKEEQFILLEDITKRLDIKLKKKKFKVIPKIKDSICNSNPEEDLGMLKQMTTDKNFQKIMKNLFPDKEFDGVLSEMLPGMDLDPGFMEYFMNELNATKTKTAKKQIKHKLKYDENETTKKSIYQIKITLDGIAPPVWRRVLVPSDSDLWELHNIIQRVMGWDGSHLYAFEIDRQSYDSEDGSEIKLNQLGVKKSFCYTYDFGDSWEHKITIEKELPVDEDKKYPLCIAGKRACPPEDCGGSWGYMDLLEAIKDPEHEDHEEMMEWVGEDFDPEYFEIDEVNEYLSPKPKKKSK